MEHVKSCGRCKNVKPFGLFYKNKCKPDGYSAVCKSCDKDSERKKRTNNIDSYRKRKREYANKRRKEDINFKLAFALRRRLNQAIRRDQRFGSAVSDLGCSIPELKKHLSSLFGPGMTWDNYGYGKDKWNIDHIVPISSFTLTNLEELKKACHYSNLQPMWTLDNIAKGNKRQS